MKLSAWRRPETFRDRARGSLRSYFGAEWRLDTWKRDDGRWGWTLSRSVRGDWVLASDGSEVAMGEARSAAVCALERKVPGPEGPRKAIGTYAH